MPSRKLETSLRNEIEWAVGVIRSHGEPSDQSLQTIHAAIEANSPVLQQRVSQFVDSARARLEPGDASRLGALLLALEARGKGEPWRLHQPGEFDDGELKRNHRLNAVVQIRCSETWKLRLRAYCERSGSDASALIRNAVEAQLADNPLWKQVPATPAAEE